MFKSFKTKELIFIALSGAIIFAVAFLIGAGLIAATGTPLVGGLINTLFLAALLVICLLTLRKFGTATLIMFVLSVLAIPTATFGPPGIYKIAVALFLGLFADTLLYLGKYKKGTYYLTIILGFIILPLVQLFFMVLLNLPGVDKVKELILILIGVYAIEALIGTWLGFLMYKKIKNKSFVRQFSQ